MDEMTWTPEPWVGQGGYSFWSQALYDGRGGPIDIWGSANARRIVVCVNACAGIPTEWLEGAPFDAIALGREVAIARLSTLREAARLLAVAERHDPDAYGWGYEIRAFLAAHPELLPQEARDGE